MPDNKYVFDFSSSHLGGGRKRLFEYSKYFNEHGGAFFIINYKSKDLIALFPQNSYLAVNKNKFQQLTSNTKYLDNFFKKNSDLDLFYSYGIPIFKKYAKVNWLHVSNILPFVKEKFPLTIFEYFKIEILRQLFKYSLKDIEVISAESMFSLDQLSDYSTKILFLSENGSDEEIAFHLNDSNKRYPRKDTAVALGTYRYKSLQDTYALFKALKVSHPALKLIIIGDKSSVPMTIANDLDVRLTGLISRDEVSKYLSNSTFYLSATLVENSYNAASEGIFLAQQSVISDIPPHKELLKSCSFEKFSLKGCERGFLKINAENLNVDNIKAWNQVIHEQITCVTRTLKHSQDA